MPNKCVLCSKASTVPQKYLLSYLLLPARLIFWTTDGRQNRYYGNTWRKKKKREFCSFSIRHSVKKTWVSSVGGCPALNIWKFFLLFAHLAYCFVSLTHDTNRNSAERTGSLDARPKAFRYILISNITKGKLLNEWWIVFYFHCKHDFTHTNLSIFLSSLLFNLHISKSVKSQKLSWN